MRLEKSDIQLETIVSRIRAGEIDLQPDFQRGEIWDLRRRQRLIDTVLREWYVPAIHIVLDPDGNEIVLDGQQRLAAIRDFFDEQFKVDGNTEPANPSIEILHGHTFSRLPEHIQRAMNRFSISVVRLRDYDPQEPNELFFRLNQSYNLTPPEKRNALHGEARNQVRRLVVELTDNGLLVRESVGFANGRLAYDDVIARTCVAVERGTLRRHINNNVVEEYYRGSPFSPETLDTVRDAGQRLIAQIEASRSLRLRFNKGTLQSWLIYCAWASRAFGGIPDTLLREFEETRQRVKSGDRSGSLGEDEAILEAVAIYDDRASYRVTDVSSVLARDLVIHLFSQERFSFPGIRDTDRLLRRMHAGVGGSTQSILFDYLDDSSWGQPLMLTGREASE